MELALGFVIPVIVLIAVLVYVLLNVGTAG